jgi:hypothetical protein
MTNIGGIGYHRSYVGKRAEMNMIDEAMTIDTDIKCPYCDINNYTKREISEYDDYPHDAYYVITEEPWTSLMITHNSKTGKYGLVANGDYSPGADIEFCPFCGRKLVEE